MERPANRLGNNIRARMEEAGITASQLAYMTGHAADTIVRYINGDRVPRATALWRISRALGCTMDNLMHGVITDDSSCDKEKQWR